MIVLNGVQSLCLKALPMTSISRKIQSTPASSAILATAGLLVIYINFIFVVAESLFFTLSGFREVLIVGREFDECFEEIIGVVVFFIIEEKKGNEVMLLVEYPSGGGEES